MLKMIENQATFIRLAAEMMLTHHGEDAVRIARDRAAASDRARDFPSPGAILRTLLGPTTGSCLSD
jgi:hypothetical protein